MVRIPAEEVSEPLKYQTWVLKVSIHCEGCKRKVKKILQNMEGVYTINIEARLQKVTVTGNINIETLIMKLIKNGKHAEPWPETLAGKEKNSCEAKNKEKEKDPKKGGESSSDGDHDNSPEKDEELKNGAKSPENIPASDQSPPARKKKKKKKGHKGKSNDGSGPQLVGAPAGTGLESIGLDVGQGWGPINLSPTRHHHMEYGVCYSAMRPIESHGPSFFVHPSPHTCADSSQEIEPVERSPLVSFETFSDENANGCSIM